MIQRLAFQNVKGTSRDEVMHPFTAIVGPNYKGKTAFADAILLALLGYNPKLGKTNAATFALASGNPMKVSAFTEHGEVARAWKQSGKSVKLDENVPEGLADPGLLLPMFDASSFIAGNDKVRLQMVASATGGTLKTTSVLPATITEILGGTFLNRNDWPKIDDKKGDVFAQATGLADAVKQSGADFAALKKRFEGTLQGLTQLDNDALPPSPKGRQAATIQEHLSTLRQRLAVARERLSHIETASESAQDATDKLNDLDVPAATAVQAARELLAEMDRKLGPARKAAAEHEANSTVMGRELTNMAASLARLVSKWGTLSAKDVGAEMDALGDVEGADGALLQQASTDLFKARSAHNVASGNLTAAAVANDKAVAAVADFDRLKCCPTCKAQAEGWKKAVLATLTAEVTTTEAARTTAAAAVREAGELVTKCQAFVEQCQARNQKATALATLQEKLTAATTMATYKLDMAEKEGRKGVAEEHAARIYGEVEDMEARRATAAGVLERAASQEVLVKAAAARPSEADEQAATQAVMDLEGEVDTASKDLVEATAAADAHKVAEQRAADIQTARETAEKATSDAAEAKRVETAIREAMDKAMADAFEVIAYHAGTLSKRVLDKTLALNAGEIGAWASGGWIPFGALSGTEQVVASAAIQAALGARTGGLVLLDEVSRLDPIRKAEFALRLAEAVKAGSIKQVVVLDHDAEFWHNLGKQGIVHVVEA